MKDFFKKAWTWIKYMCGTYSSTIACGISMSLSALMLFSLVFIPLVINIILTPIAVLLVSYFLLKKSGKITESNRKEMLFAILMGIVWAILCVFFI